MIRQKKGGRQSPLLINQLLLTRTKIHPSPSVVISQFIGFFKKRKNLCVCVQNKQVSREQETFWILIVRVAINYKLLHVSTRNQFGSSGSAVNALEG